MLPAVSLGEIGTDFNYRAVVASCEEQNVNLVPINIVCEDFPRVDGGSGAPGIGYLENKLGYNKTFVPKIGKELNNVLNYTARILDDVILEHKVFFHVGTEFSKRAVSLNAHCSTETDMT